MSTMEDTYNKPEESVDAIKEKIQKCYTEIWKNMMYPYEMKGKPKADDILKREFPFLKVE